MKILIFKVDLLKNDIAVLTNKLFNVSSKVSFNLESKVLRVELWDESKVNSVIEAVQSSTEILRFTIEDDAHKLNNNLFDLSTLEFKDENVKKTVNKIYWLLYNKSISDNQVNSDIIELLTSLSSVENSEKEQVVDEELNKDLNNNAPAHENEPSIEPTENEVKEKKLFGNKHILSAIKPKIKKINRNLPLESKISAFLDAIDFENSEVIIKAFVIANSIYETPKEKLSYEKFIPGIIENTSMKNPDEIKEYFSDCFKAWVNKYPEVINEDGRENFISLIRIFYKFFGKSVDDQSKSEQISNYNDNPEILEVALSKLDVNKPYQLQVDTFMRDIDIQKDYDFIKNLFVISCEIKKVNIENIVYEIVKIYPKMSYNSTISKIKNIHEDWLFFHPAFEQKYGKKTMLHLFRVFARKFK